MGSGVIAYFEAGFIIWLAGFSAILPAEVTIWPARFIIWLPGILPILDYLASRIFGYLPPGLTIWPAGLTFWPA